VSLSVRDLPFAWPDLEAATCLRDLRDEAGGSPLFPFFQTHFSRVSAFSAPSEISSEPKAVAGGSFHLSPEAGPSTFSPSSSQKT